MCGGGGEYHRLCVCVGVSTIIYAYVWGGGYHHLCVCVAGVSTIIYVCGREVSTIVYVCVRGEYYASMSVCVGVGESFLRESKMSGTR